MIGVTSSVVSDLFRLNLPARAMLQLVAGRVAWVSKDGLAQLAIHLFILSPSSQRAHMGS
jgi:hypothetical protein